MNSLRVVTSNLLRALPTYDLCQEPLRILLIPGGKVAPGRNLEVCPGSSRSSQHRRTPRQTCESPRHHDAQPGGELQWTKRMFIGELAAASMSLGLE